MEETRYLLDDKQGCSLSHMVVWAKAEVRSRSDERTVR